MSVNTPLPFTEQHLADVYIRFALKLTRKDMTECYITEFHRSQIAVSRVSSTPLLIKKPCATSMSSGVVTCIEQRQHVMCQL